MGLFKNIQDLIFQVTTHDHYATYDDELAARTNELSTNSLNNGSNTSISMLDNSSSTSLANHSNRSSMTGNNNTTNNNNNTNPVNYRPGLRSNQIHNSVGNINNNSSGRPSNDVPLQDYINGQPPLPSIASIWERIDDWCENEFPELGDDIEDGATTNDLNAFERDLKIHLPLDIRESYQIHDGEVQMGKKRGLIYSNPLMDLESIASETMVWRKAALKVQNTINNYKQNELMNNTTNHSQDIKDPNLGSSSSSSATASADIPLKLPPNHPIARFIHNQRSIPDGAIQEVYAHDNWIPLVKDNVGNNIAVDLAPGQRGKWGQIILFGRDYDTKYI
ncbi:unnamed protein product [[Candida] boidinii]|nr:unnamed protein product [[Candida] boidinii]